jgi:hypothetical protein
MLRGSSGKVRSEKDFIANICAALWLFDRPGEQVLQDAET